MMYIYDEEFLNSGLEEQKSRLQSMLEEILQYQYKGACSIQVDPTTDNLAITSPSVPYFTINRLLRELNIEVSFQAGPEENRQNGTNTLDLQAIVNSLKSLSITPDIFRAYYKYKIKSLLDEVMGGKPSNVGDDFFKRDKSPVKGLDGLDVLEISGISDEQIEKLTQYFRDELKFQVEETDNEVKFLIPDVNKKYKNNQYITINSEKKLIVNNARAFYAYLDCYEKKRKEKIPLAKDIPSLLEGICEIDAGNVVVVLEPGQEGSEKGVVTYYSFQLKSENNEEVIAKLEKKIPGGYKIVNDQVFLKDFGYQELVRIKNVEKRKQKVSEDLQGINKSVGARNQVLSKLRITATDSAPQKEELKAIYVESNEQDRKILDQAKQTIRERFPYALVYDVYHEQNIQEISALEIIFKDTTDAKAFIENFKQHNKDAKVLSLNNTVFLPVKYITSLQKHWQSKQQEMNSRNPSFDSNPVSTIQTHEITNTDLENCKNELGSILTKLNITNSNLKISRVEKVGSDKCPYKLEIHFAGQKDEDNFSEKIWKYLPRSARGNVYIDKTKEKSSNIQGTFKIKDIKLFSQGVSEILKGQDFQAYHDIISRINELESEMQKLRSSNGSAPERGRLGFFPFSDYHDYQRKLSKVEGLRAIITSALDQYNCDFGQAIKTYKTEHAEKWKDLTKGWSSKTKGWSSRTEELLNDIVANSAREGTLRPGNR